MSKQTAVAVAVAIATAEDTKAYIASVYAVAMTGQRAQQTMMQKLSAMLTERYGDTSPTFEEYRADQKALAELAKARKLASDQWVRKPYAAAVKARYGKLPESMAPEAVLKRAQREADKAAKNQAAPVGAPAGETQPREPSPQETLEAIVTRLGLFKCLDACIAILAADKATSAPAIHMRKQAEKAAQLAAAKSETAATAPTLNVPPIGPDAPAFAQALVQASAKASKQRKAA